MDALVIRRPWIDKILDHTKTWEIRGRRTEKRGVIGLIEGGSGTVVGTCRLVDVVGPLSRSEFITNAKKAGFSCDDVATSPLPYERTYGWVVEDARRLNTPVQYEHPSGAVIWARLSSDVEKSIRRQMFSNSK